MSGIRCVKDEETILKGCMAKTQPLCDLDLKIYLMTAVADDVVFNEYKGQHSNSGRQNDAGD
jgi:hypothetical protein